MSTDTSRTAPGAGKFVAAAGPAENQARRIAEYARLLGRLAGLDERGAELLHRAAPRLVAVSPGLVDAPLRQATAIILEERQERWDGRGYPNGFRGEQIHLFGRIAALVEVFDALRHPRWYTEPWPLKRTLEYLREERGGRFDPALVDLFVDHLDEFVAVYTRLPNPERMH